MENKVLIKLIVPEINNEFDVFIPVNEVIWKVKKLIVKSISDLTNIDLDLKDSYCLINKCNSKIYDNNEIVINTDIRNASELVLISLNSSII